VWFVVPVYGVVPPVADTFTAPVLPPLQATLVTEAETESAADGCVMLPEVAEVQPLASVTV